jgi:hypothetical protein
VAAGGGEIYWQRGSSTPVDLFSRRFLEVVWTFGLFNGSLRARACDRCSTRPALRRGERFVGSIMDRGARWLPSFFKKKKALEEKLERVQILNLFSFRYYYLSLSLTIAFISSTLFLYLSFLGTLFLFL